MADRLWLGVLLFALGTALFADPATTVSATYEVTAQDGSDWTTEQAATLGLSSRSGALQFDGQLRAPFNNSLLTADALLSRLTITWNLNEWSVVTFGKQRLKWGTARVFSAVDGLEAVYDPLHPRATLDGVTGVKAEILPNDWLSLSLLVLPAPTLVNSREAARVDVLWNEADLSAGVVHSELSGTHRWSSYVDAAWFLDRFGVYAEASLKSWRDRDWSLTTTAGTLGLTNPAQWVPKATVGTQIEFPVWLHGTLRWLSEYHYNGEGFTTAEADDFRQAWDHRVTASSNFVPPTLGVATFSRHYAYTGLSGLPLTEKLTAGASVLAGLDTHFVLARLSTTYQVDQGLWASLDYTHFATLFGDAANEAMLIDPTNQITLSVGCTL